MSVKTENRCKEIISLFCVKNSKRKVYQHGLNKKKKKKCLVQHSKNVTKSNRYLKKGRKYKS